MRTGFHHRSWGVLSLCCLAIGVAIAPAAAMETSTISGRVTDFEDRPLAGVLITVTGEGVGPGHTFSKSGGTFRLPALRPFTRYAVSAGLAGYRTVEYDGFVLEPRRVRRVDFRLKPPGLREVVALLSRDPYPHDEMMRGLQRRLRVPLRVVDLDAERDPAAAVRRVRAEHPSLIIGAGVLAARHIRREIPDVPAILTRLPDARRFDLEAPNICFLADTPSADDLLARLAHLLPDLRRLAVVYDTDTSVLLARDLRLAADRRGLHLELRPCYSPADLRRVLDPLAGRIDAVVVPFDPLSLDPAAADLLIGWALRHKVALAAPEPAWVRRGALLSYGAPADRIGEEFSLIATRIVDQEMEPADVGLRWARTFLPDLNLDTAARLGITFPPEIESRTFRGGAGRR